MCCFIVKRTAETIAVGNHQNHARVKKSGPVEEPREIIDDEEEDIDKKASIKTDVSPAQDMDKSSPDVVDETEGEDKADVTEPSVLGMDDAEKSLEELLDTNKASEDNEEEETSLEQLKPYEYASSVDVINNLQQSHLPQGLNFCYL